MFFKQCCFVFYRTGRESDSEAEDFEHAEKLRQVKAVLEEVIYLVSLRLTIFFIGISSYIDPFSFIPSFCDPFPFTPSRQLKIR